ncbi:MAG: Ppx/GppA family phosphatase, partial [candidate division KSB1 bacterium]|nr:Ppx/GppA family phosphatase [candidate division KSB1 bacterium]
MAIYAVIDIGTNAIKFHLAEKLFGGNWQTIMDRGEVTRLGSGLNQTGQLNPQAMARTLAVIIEMVQQARQNRAQQIIAIGTMALRTATNAMDFVELLKRECQLEVEIISGEAEARYSFLAVKSSLDLADDDFGIFDIGGGSTEFIWGHRGQLSHQLSLNLGVVRLTEDILRSDPVTPTECEKVIEEIEAMFQAIPITQPLKKLIGVGATMTTLGAMKHRLPVYDSEFIHGKPLAATEIADLVALLQSKTIAQRKQIIGLAPSRADVILAGAMIVQVILRK